jgi:hypothetical protein
LPPQRICLGRPERGENVLGCRFVGHEKCLAHIMYCSDVPN